MPLCRLQLSLIFQAFKDWHLVLGTSILVGIVTLMVIVSFAVPIFRGSPDPVPDIERPEGMTVRSVR